MTVASGDSFAANRERVAWQAETRSNQRKRMEFCNALISEENRRLRPDLGDVPPALLRVGRGHEASRKLTCSPC